MRIANRTQAFEWYHFQLPSVTDGHRPPSHIWQRPGQRHSSSCQRHCQTTALCQHSILVVSPTRNSFGDMTFAAAGPQVWNSLPPLISDYVACHTATPGGYEGIFIRQCELFVPAPNRNILTILTYFNLSLTDTARSLSAIAELLSHFSCRNIGYWHLCC